MYCKKIPGYPGTSGSNYQYANQTAFLNLQSFCTAVLYCYAFLVTVDIKAVIVIIQIINGL